jgi:hypothetical protein
MQPERGVKFDNKEYNKRSVYGIDSGKLIMNTKNGLSYKK